MGRSKKDVPDQRQTFDLLNRGKHVEGRTVNDKKVALTVFFENSEGKSSTGSVSFKWNMEAMSYDRETNEATLEQVQGMMLDAAEAILKIHQGKVDKASGAGKGQGKLDLSAKGEKANGNPLPRG